MDDVDADAERRFSAGTLPQGVAVAVRLMTVALVLLDRSGRRLAAVRLQHAIDEVLRDCRGGSGPADAT